METVILICLLLIIALLLQDKIAAGKDQQEKPKHEKTNPKLPDIMGHPKPLRSLLLPKRAAEIPDKKQLQETDNFDIEINEDLFAQIPEDELNAIFRNAADLREEQEEWNSYGISGSDDGFAQGVTLEELSSVGMLLQKERLEHSEQETATALVQKIQGTELFSLLENSIESASRKIAALLDGSLSSEKEDTSLNLRKDELNDFNIGDFV
ncbi:conjugal transfer protein TraD [Flavobacterium notoginsengisoli]|uniref:conjugal transfer protein TraD n=1 Tax=Flavobacterium notoginsengisoli TaxID=1478199 RepID=UPI003633C5AB